MAIKNDFQNILITHIINPHMFWFRYDSLNKANDVLYQIEKRLLKYVYNTSAIAAFPTGYEAKNGEIVLVQRNIKWIRAMIDYTIKNNDANKYKEYIVWSIDDGWVSVLFFWFFLFQLHPQSDYN